MTEELEELLAREGLLPLAALLPDLHPQTRLNWVRRGVRGVRLEATLDGGRWVSTQAALDRFRARLRGQAVPTPAQETSELVRRAQESRARFLRRIGREP